MAFQRMSKYGQKPSDKKREERVAKEHGGRRVAGSGNTPWSKEDVSTDTYLIQHKHTDAKSISVRQRDLEELRKNAVDVDKEPLFIIEYGEKNYYIIEEHLFNELNRAIQDLP